MQFGTVDSRGASRRLITTFMFSTGIGNGRTRVDEMGSCGHYARWREDFALTKEIGIGYLRYGPPIHPPRKPRGEPQGRSAQFQAIPRARPEHSAEQSSSTQIDFAMDASEPSAASPSARPVRDFRWRILGAGDAVSVSGEGVYEIIHISQAKAWLSGLEDGTQRLVDAARLELLQPAKAIRHG